MICSLNFQPQSPQETKPCTKRQVLSLPREPTLCTLPLGLFSFLSLGTRLQCSIPQQSSNHGHDPYGWVQQRVKYRHREGREGPNALSFDMNGYFQLWTRIKRELPVRHPTTNPSNLQGAQWNLHRLCCWRDLGSNPALVIYCHALEGKMEHLSEP